MGDSQVVQGADVFFPVRRFRSKIAGCLATATLVAVGSAALGSLAPASGDTGSLAPAPKRIYVVVVDGMRPFDVTPALMPRLTELKAQGTWYSDARAVFPTETLPNHSAMMTGVVPFRNGIVGNKYLPQGPNVNGGQYNDSPSHFLSDTLVTRLERSCGPAVETATTLSKTYLYRAFAGEPESAGPDRQLEADFHWAPSPVIPVSEHSPDAATLETGFLPWMRSHSTPQFAFVNLGDVDRAGHADNGGNTLVDSNPNDGKAPDPGDERVERQNGFQRATMSDTDTLLGRFVDELKDSGAWDETVLILLSDHGMNWADQSHWIDTAFVLQNTQRVDNTGPYRRATDFLVVNNGAADGVYMRENDPAERRHMVEAIRNEAGVERVFVDSDDMSSAGSAPQHPRSAYGLQGDRAADIVVIAKPGYSFNQFRTPNSDPSTNPVPGVHGHAVTEHSALLVTGGHPSLASAGPGGAAKTVDGVPVWPIPADRAPLAPNGGPGTLSIAPTVAALTGLGDIAGAGYDGQLLSQAFDSGALGRSEPFCAGIDPPPPLPPDGDGTTPPEGGGDADGEGRPIAINGSAVTTLAPSSRRASYGRPFTLSGRVTATDCLRPEWVEIRRRTAGAAAYAPLAEIATSPTGRWHAEFAAQKNATYVAVPDATRCGTKVSRAVKVPVRARVVIKSGLACSDRTRVKGVVQPAQPGTAVLLQRRVQRRWQTLSRAKLDSRSRFSLRDTSCRRGRHRVVWPRQGRSNAAGEARFRR